MDFLTSIFSLCSEEKHDDSGLRQTIWCTELKQRLFSINLLPCFKNI